MAQAQRSAETRKPLTVQKSAIVRKRGVSGAVPGADMPFVDRAAAMANDDAKAPDPTTPLFPKAAEADSPEPAPGKARSMALDRARGMLGATFVARLSEPDLQRRVMLGAAAAVLLVISGGLAMAVIGDRGAAQTSIASVSEPAPVPAPTPPQEPVVATAQAPADAAVARAAPAPGAAPAETDIVSQFAQTALAALRSPGAAPVQPAAPDAAARMAENNRLYRMVAEAIAQGQSDAYIDRLLNAAHQRGEITVPPGLIKPDGTVDTKTVVALFAGG